MNIVVIFNPKLISGKTINLVVNKSLEDEIAQEYSGKWLIIESEHYCDEDAAPYSKLTVAKYGITVDSNHPFKNDFTL